MFRYVAFVWDDSDAAQSAAAQLLASRLQLDSTNWNSTLLLSGMQVFCADVRPGASEIYSLRDASGIVLGTVFEPCDPQSAAAAPKKVFSASESRQILATGCRSLLTTCWGRYVAFAHDAANRKSYVLRDPSGGLPCYRVQFRKVDIYFSSAEDIARLGLLQLTINWDYMAARVAFVFLHTPATAINDMTMVLPGEHLEIHHGSTARSFAWNPLLISQTDVIESADIAAQELHRVAKSSVRSWASCYESVLLKLSGGLDSSIVLGCLQDAKPAITCLNYYSPGSDGDERTFARLAASRAGVPLLERERISDAHLEDMLNISRSPAPTYYLGSLQTSRMEAQLAREIGVAAYFSGGGGDQLFYQAKGMLSAADYLRMHGLNRRFIEVALDAAHLEHHSIWHVIREAYRNKRSVPIGNMRSTVVSQRKLVADDAISRALQRGGFVHPMFESTSETPTGKLWQAYALSMPQEFYDPLGSPSDPESVQPLMSQPLIELCLRTPTYVLTHSGWDRAVARQAFRGDVPREILRRRSKGGMNENVQQILTRNLQLARDLLLDGQLVKAGLLDRSRLDEVLSDRPTRAVGAVSEIFDHLSTEVWLRRWGSAAL